MTWASTAVRRTDREVGATATKRRVGAETSKTRDAVLDSVEGLLLDEGYAGVSYRAVASKAVAPRGETPSCSAGEERVAATMSTM